MERNGLLLINLYSSNYINVIGLFVLPLLNHSVIAAR
jgi:hypothetical protein